MQQPGFCAICGFGGPDGLTSVIIEGRRFSFCEGHATELRPNVPTTWSELRGRFGAVGIEQRNLTPRRLGPARGPSRTTERRESTGRRAGD
jgi:hypothetical protein